MSTGIVVALPEELSTLTTKQLAKGHIGSLTDNILVVYSGAGAENARAASELLVANGTKQLISWGCAAALDPGYRPGDLVLASSCVDADQVTVDLNNADWLSSTKASLTERTKVRSFVGKLAESKTIVAASQDKLRLAQATSAAAIDMESVAIAKVAQKHGLPFLSIRAIADPLNMSLPKAVSHALNHQGDIVLARLLIYLLWHPTELPGLISLGLHFHAAKNTLKQVAKVLDEITHFSTQPKPTTKPAE